ncbi:MAG: cytochrome P450 [Rhizomicrobium sp.]|jgi:cytochrome P450
MADAHVLAAITDCPYHQGGDERKSTGAPRSAPGAIVIGSFGLSRQILRSGLVRQAGFNAELLERFAAGGHAPVLYQEGEAHQKQRSASARFFAPKIVATQYRALMERLSDALIARLLTTRRAHLDRMSLEIAVAVAAEIVGLTNSPRSGMAQRLSRFFATKARDRNPVTAFVTFLLARTSVLWFFIRDVAPAIRARRRSPRDDVISHLIGQGYSNREILTECLTYAAAGMVTTREFIVMAAWHLFEREELKARFLGTDETGRIAILEEILRLEPVVGVLYRRAAHELTFEVSGEVLHIPAESLLALDVRGTNTDRAAAGECPFELDPDRARVGVNQSASVMSFGDGPHRCPGAAVALQEAAIFLDRLLRVPGVKLQKAPALAFNPLIASYELRGAIVAID